MLFSLVRYLVWLERLSIFAFVDFLLNAKDGSRQKFLRNVSFIIADESNFDDLDSFYFEFLWGIHLEKHD